MDLSSFSIVVPTYQRRAMVCEMVRKLCGLSYAGATEIIVVVDGSSDGTAAALADLQCALPLKIIEQPNRGLAAARNRGAAEATGDILLFLDDDMMVDPDLLEQHAGSCAAGADAVVGDFTEPDGRRFGMSAQNPAGDEEAVSTPFGVYGGHISIRRSVFEAVGGFDESFTANGAYGYEDSDLAARLLERFAVRRNHRAVTHHKTVLRPREYVGRAPACAEAERRLIAKHPELAAELAEWTGASRLSGRLRLLSRLPVVPEVLAAGAAWLAEIGVRTPFRSSAAVRYLCDAGYTLSYWSAARRKG